jgi:cation diffusion facilitator CzcD-associated flavoprotein CzcO
MVSEPGCHNHHAAKQQVRKITVKSLKTGETVEEEADVVVSARGTLNDISWPKIEGFSDVKIPVMHSAIWDDR